MSASSSIQISDYLQPGRHAHLVGIGGVSMRPLGLVLRMMGLTISGSDMNASVSTDELVSQGIQVSVLDSAGSILASAMFHDLPDCTIACTLYDVRGQMVSGDLKASGGASFAAEGGAVRARLLFLSVDGYVPVRPAETLWLAA